MSDLDLREIPSEFHDQARAAFAAGDWAGFVYSTSGGRSLALVCDNIIPLREAGIYEPALLAALTGPRVNHHHWSMFVLRSMLTFADRGRLRAAGNLLPPGPGPFTLYRGVAGRGPARRVRGFHWTARPAVAAWFSRRMRLEDPAVVLATVPSDAVLAYTNDRDEEDFLVLLPRHVRPRRLSLPQLAARDERAARVLSAPDLEPFPAIEESAR